MKSFGPGTSIRGSTLLGSHANDVSLVRAMSILLVSFKNAGEIWLQSVLSQLVSSSSLLLVSSGESLIWMDLLRSEHRKSSVQPQDGLAEQMGFGTVIILSPKSTIQMTAKLLRKDRMDATRLGMESLCLLTDLSQTGMENAPIASQVVLFVSNQLQARKKKRQILFKTNLAFAGLFFRWSSLANCDFDSDSEDEDNVAGSRSPPKRCEQYCHRRFLGLGWYVFGRV